MSKAKFEKGDRVKVVFTMGCDQNATDIKIGDVGRVVTDYEPGYGYQVKFDSPIEFKHMYNTPYYKPQQNIVVMTDSQLELIKRKNDEKIIIYRDDNQVIALDKATGKKGIRKCNPADTFDFNIGAKLAFERLTANVTFKMLCIESDNYFVTKGKTYEFVNGVTTYDTGRESCKYKNFAEYVRFNPGIERFVIELKDGDDPDEILKKHDSTIRVGDTVEIVDRNKTYRLYTEWVVEHIANKSDIRYFCYNRLPFTGLKCKVLHIAKHNSHYENLAYVKSESNECYVIAVDGLKKV